MDDLLKKAAQDLANGKLVAFPTETVYGLGADAENPAAVAKIYQAKERPSNHPVIVHIADNADLHYWVKNVPSDAQKLIQVFWPGPLTLILNRADHIPDAVSGGQSSVGVRCPSHPVAQQLLKAFAASKPSQQGGIAAPSANRFGHVSPTQALHVRSEFPKEIAMGMLVLEGGESEVGIESTIVDLSRVEQGVAAVLLRPGHISLAQLEKVLGYAPSRPDAQAPRASGTLKAHYAPHTPLKLLSQQALHEHYAGLAQSISRDKKVVILAFDALQPSTAADIHCVAQNPVQYAHDLYALLRQVDSLGYQEIWVQALPQDDSWEAVNDRLQRAAAAFGG